MSGKVLWLHTQKLTPNMRVPFEALIDHGEHAVNRDEILYVNLRLRVPDIWERKPGTKNTWQRNSNREQMVHEYLEGLIKKHGISLIIIQDHVALNYITEKQTSLSTCRGSVYYYGTAGTPSIVIDEPHMFHGQRSGKWMFANDFNKVQRWYHGKQRYEPRFNYAVCRNRADLDECLSRSREAALASTDIETVGKFISCVGYTYIERDGTLSSFVIPFINPLKPNACHWDNADDEIYAWKIVKEINARPDLLKVLQNGVYDAAYFIVNNCPLVNFMGDTAVMWHSVFTEAPKKLNVISSVLLDYYRFWKDEMKGDKQDAKKSERIPQTHEGLERYWRYNALDCHYTLLNFRVLLMLLLKVTDKDKNTWCLTNYVRMFSNQVGPAFAMAMRGMLTSRFAMIEKSEAEMEKHYKALDKFRTMCADHSLNPNSPDQIASLIYDVLGATPIKARGKKKSSGRSTDERVLKLIADQHPMFRVFIEALWEVKKPLNNANKYGNLHLINNRFLYSLGITRTGTERFGSGEHSFHVGTNAQNIPKWWQDMFHADPDYILANLDYSQSDAWFIAYQSQEPKMIEVMNDPRDTHCLHAEHFFHRPYQEIYDAHQVEADWTDHPTKGVRQNTKRIVHGSNFRMEAFTLYQTMGHEAVVAAAIAVGKNDAHGWKIDEAVAFCSELLDAYHHLYPHLRNDEDNWFDEVVAECVKNGNLATFL